MAKTAKTKQTYEVVADGFLFGDFYKVGDRISLYPEQAVHDMPPHGSMLKPVAKPSEPARS